MCEHITQKATYSYYYSICYSWDGNNNNNVYDDDDGDDWGFCNGKKKSYSYQSLVTTS